MITWVYAFIDRRAPTFDAAAAFWTAVTATTLSPRRGADDEFATLLPTDSDAYLKIQATPDMGFGHLDLVTDDVTALTAQALGRGARVATEHEGWNVMRSLGASYVREGAAWTVMRDHPASSTA